MNEKSCNQAQGFLDKDFQKCPIKDVVARIGDKWSLHTILYLGAQGRSRFNLIKKEIKGISQRMLTVTLRTLEQDGYISRTFYPQVPPRVEYELTDLGKGLLEQVTMLSVWAAKNMQQILEARKTYNEKASHRVLDIH